jgi:hypothetical protein
MTENTNTERLPVSTVEVLEAARELLVSKGWTQGCYGRDASGKSLFTSELAEHAACFCGWGAVQAVCGGDGSVNYTPGLWSAMGALDAAVPYVTNPEFHSTAKHFPSFNDTPGRTVEEVLAVFDKAIADQRAFEGSLKQAA